MEAFLLLPLTLVLLAVVLRWGLNLWEESRAWQLLPEKEREWPEKSIRLTDTALERMQPVLELLPKELGESLRKEGEKLWPSGD